MENQDKKKRLYAEHGYFAFIYSFMLVLSIFIIIYAKKVFTKSELIWEIIFYSVFFIMVVYYIFELLRHIQIATISKNGIVIKNIFGTISSVRWEEIIKIHIENRVYPGRSRFSLKRIVIRTKENKSVSIHEKRSKNKIFPMEINATKKNISILVESLKLYNLDLYKKYCMYTKKEKWFKSVKD